ncbi:MAG: ATP-binding cassette domain-containing protein [bacterium]|nr:ATP-binding cassette domain-containing protein [bacterium]
MSASDLAVSGELLLSVRGLTVRYGRMTAVDSFDLDVRAGQIVGLIGPNGAGKTSLVDALTGFTPASGSIKLGDRELSRARAHRRSRAGLIRNWQSLELFDDLTVEENIRVALLTGAGLQGLRESGLTQDQVVASVLERVGLNVGFDQFPSALSQGQRKLLGLARSLASFPRVLLADEPAAGLDTVESGQLAGRLRAIADGGLGVLLIDHDMGLVLNLCDYIYVIDFGKPLAHGTPAEIRNNPAVIAAYLGGRTEQAGNDGGVPLVAPNEEVAS